MAGDPVRHHHAVAPKADRERLAEERILHVGGSQLQQGLPPLDNQLALDVPAVAAQLGS